jgi:hypothetical protein
VAFNLFTNRFHRSVRPEEAIRKRLVLAQEPQQQVLRFDVRRTELAGFVAREEDYAPRFLRIAFEHFFPL